MPKSIIDVEVKDGAFQRFTELFNKYTEELKSLPGAWGDVGSAVDASAQGYISMTAALMAQKQALNDIEKAEKKRRDAEKKAQEQERKRAAILKGMWTDANKLAKSMASVTAELFKWVGIGGIIGGLTGAGGLWGLDALAGRVGDVRRTAQGYGISTAQQQAMSVNFGRYLDTNSALENVADAQSDYGKRWGFRAMGMDPAGKDPAQLLVEMMSRAKELFDKSDQSKQFAEAHGLTQFFTMDELRRLHNISTAELRSAQSGYGRDARALGYSDAVARRWQDFSIQMDRAKLSIQAALVDGLTPLIPQLSKLSAAVAQAITAFLTNPHVKDWIEGFGEAIKRVGTYLASPKFQSDIKVFMDDFAALVTWIVNRLADLGIVPDAIGIGGAAGNSSFGSQLDTTNGVRRDNATENDSGDFWSKKSKGYEARNQAAMDYFIKHGLTRGQAAGLVANLNGESGDLPDTVGDNGQALGAAQWHADRQKQFEQVFGHKLKDSSLQEQWDFVLWELTHTFKSVGDRLRETKDPFDAAALIAKDYERPRDALGAIRDRGPKAEVILHVYNSAGASVSTQASQLPQ